MKMSLSFICREKSASMRGMSAILKILSGIVGMLLLSSCGVQIQLTTLRPAAVDIGRGALITVHNLSGGRASAALTEAVCNHILTDGFYELSHRGRGVCLELHNVHLDNPPPPRHHEERPGGKKHSTSRPSPRLSAVVIVRSCGQQLYRRDHTETVWVNSDGRMDLLEACEDFAEEIMDDLVPRRVLYSEYITPDENIPALEEAARACAAGNWSMGRTLVERVLAVNPACAEAYYLLGLIARNEGDYSASDSCFSRANSLSPQSKYAEGLRDNARMQQNEARAQSQMH